MIALHVGLVLHWLGVFQWCGVNHQTARNSMLKSHIRNHSRRGIESRGMNLV